MWEGLLDLPGAVAGGAPAIAASAAPTSADRLCDVTLVTAIAVTVLALAIAVAIRLRALAIRALLIVRPSHRRTFLSRL